MKKSGLLLTTAFMVFNFAPSMAKVVMNYDEALMREDVTAENFEDHLDNLAVLLLENRNDLLKKMDSKAYKLGDEERAVIKANVHKLNDYELVALQAALDVRDEKKGNENALADVLDRLDKEVEKRNL